MDDFFVHDVVDALFAFDHVVRHSDPRPSVDYAKDWPDQSFPFLAWSGVVLYGLVKADCLYHDIWQFFAAWWHFLSVILVAGS